MWRSNQQMVSRLSWNGMEARSASLFIMLLSGAAISAIMLLGAIAIDAYRLHPNRVFDEDDGEEQPSRGVSDEVINSFPVFIFDSKGAAEEKGAPEEAPSVDLEEGNARSECCSGNCKPMNHFEQLTCAICLSEFEAAEKVKELPCGHWFHPACIDEWLRSQGSCPLCNRRVVDDEEDEPVSSGSDDDDDNDDGDGDGNDNASAESGEEDGEDERGEMEQAEEQPEREEWRAANIAIRTEEDDLSVPLISA
jgi:hypothetical protein